MIVIPRLVCPGTLFEQALEYSWFEKHLPYFVSTQHTTFLIGVGEPRLATFVHVRAEPSLEFYLSEVRSVWHLADPLVPCILACTRRVVFFRVFALKLPNTFFEAQVWLIVFAQKVFLAGNAKATVGPVHVLWGLKVDSAFVRG